MGTPGWAVALGGWWHVLVWGTNEGTGLHVAQGQGISSDPIPNAQGGAWAPCVDCDGAALVSVPAAAAVSLGAQAGPGWSRLSSLSLLGHRRRRQP